MIHIYIKDPIPPPKENEEDPVKDRISPGNVAWDLVNNIIKYKSVTIHNISKYQSVIMVEQFDINFVPQHLKNWVKEIKTI